MNRNIIEIHYAKNLVGYVVYFTDRRGSKVYARVDDPQSLLNMRQKEAFFMGSFVFGVPDSTIKDLEKLINFPA